MELIKDFRRCNYCIEEGVPCQFLESIKIMSKVQSQTTKDIFEDDIPVYKALGCPNVVEKKNED